MTTDVRVRSGFSVRDALGYGSLAVAIVGALVAGRAEAGLADLWVIVGLATAIPLAIVARVWTLPTWLLVVSALVPVSIVLVGLVSDGGWSGAARATRFGWAVIVLLGVLAWTRSPGRRLAAIIGALALVGDQFVVGWFAWWGGADPDRLMIGSFSWHNQFAAYMLIGAGAAIVVAVLAERAVALLGGTVFALAAVGVIASGSRSAAVLLAGAALVGLLISYRASRGAGLIRWGASVSAALLATVFFFSTAFFPATDAGSLAGGLAGRSSAEGSWVARLDHWRVALEMGAESWLFGSGLSTYGLRSDCFDRQYYTSNPHNEWLLAWAEGGLVMALPLVALLVAAIVIAIRSVRPLPTASALTGDVGRWAALVGVVLALGHAAFDFDWAFPLLIVLAGVMGGVAGAPVVTPLSRVRPVGASIAATAALAVIASSLAGFALDPHPGTSLKNGELRAEAIDLPCER